MKISILIAAHKRNELLTLGLKSLAVQTFQYETELLVLDESANEAELVCHTFRNKLPIRYIPTSKGEVWRVPSYALNIGVKKAEGEIIVITCPEMWHINETVDLLVEAVVSDPFALAIPWGKDDRKGVYLEEIQRTGIHNAKKFKKLRKLPVQYPFLMALRKEHLEKIRGYDEDFTGIGYDDDDLIGRLHKIGCHHTPTNALTVHLFHPRIAERKESLERKNYNRDLWLNRKGKIVRNENIDWGTAFLL